MTLDLVSWEAKLVLEALRTLEAKWDAIIDSTEDEDVQSDYGNDLALLQLFIKRIEPEMSAEFGSSVKDFSRAPAGFTTTPDARTPNMP